MKRVQKAVEDYKRIDLDEETDQIVFLDAKREVSVMAIIGKWAMVREKNKTPHVAHISKLTPNAKDEASE